MLVLDHLRTAACIIHFYSYLFVSFFVCFLVCFYFGLFFKRKKSSSSEQNTANNMINHTWLVSIKPSNGYVHQRLSCTTETFQVNYLKLLSYDVKSLQKKKPKKTKQNEVNKSKVLTIQFRVTWNVESFFRSCACSFIWVPMSFLIIFLHINVCPI